MAAHFVEGQGLRTHLVLRGLWIIKKVRGRFCQGLWRQAVLHKFRDRHPPESNVKQADEAAFQQEVQNDKAADRAQAIAQHHGRFLQGYFRRNRARAGQRDIASGKCIKFFILAHQCMRECPVRSARLQALSHIRCQHGYHMNEGVFATDQRRRPFQRRRDPLNFPTA